MDSRKLLFAVVGVTALALIVVVSGSHDSGEADRLERLRALELPSDGAPLFQTLLREIPDVVSEIPCGCCSQTLAWCYEGGCPPD